MSKDYTMSLLEKFPISSWEVPISAENQKKAIDDLESGKVLYFEKLPFSLDEDELQFLSPSILDGKAKNISLDKKKNRLSGTLLSPEKAELLKKMLRRYSHYSQAFLEKLLPYYAPYLSQGRTSFRPIEIAGRKTSYRKDDTRLHVDAFPSSPTKGYRILRVFTNINHEGKPRVWRVGEPLESVFDQFLSGAPSPIFGVASLLKWLGITKDYRTPYDHYMLQVHDKMKGDDSYQRNTKQEEVQFPPGSTWIVYTDQVSHAAMSGQHVLEQTFHIPIGGLKDENTSPLRVMEKFLDKKLN